MTPQGGSLRVVLAGGGSGGHITPALAIYEGLQTRLGHNVDVLYVGTEHGLERDLVPRAGVAFRTVHAGALLRRGFGGKLRAVAETARGLVDAWRLLGQFRPRVVVGTGGYVSGPVGLAAVGRGIPLVLQEQNVWPGFTNRMLARRAHAICVPFAEAVRYLPDGSRAIVSGNPVRPSLLAISRDAARERLGVGADDVLLVASGGSQGAPAINNFLLRMWPALAGQPHVHVRWATGPRRYDAVAARLPEAAGSGSRLQVLPYLYDMDWALKAADVVVGRAGANTCNEVLACGLAALLVPSPFVSEDHQTKNAAHLADAGAAVMVAEADLERDGPDVLQALLSDRGRREALCRAARGQFRPDALDRIVEAVLAAAGRAGPGPEDSGP
jgi:UDP-N-acetylglucosamine--N-acetylmuramyl-(pentapeptide) pyrophosphoryl-undecaprenol N-acetylglucosamine transferase